MIYLLTFVAGGAAVTLTAYLAKNGHPDYAGVIMTMPVITMISLALTPAGNAMTVATWGMAGLGAAALFIGVYLGAFTLLGEQYKLAGLLLSVVTWIAAVRALFMLRQ